MPLRLIIENTPANDFASLPLNAPSDFIEAALHAAQNSKSTARAAVIADVCNVLNCREEDLQFLFQHNTVLSQPFSDLELELPDYRMSQNEISKLAAE